MKDNRLGVLEARVKALKKEVSKDTIYAIIISGHQVYKQGIGLPHEVVIATIENALKDE